MRLPLLSGVWGFPNKQNPDEGLVGSEASLPMLAVIPFGYIPTRDGRKTNEQ